MSDKRIEVTVWRGCEYDELPPSGLLDFRDWLREKIESIPPAHRHTATIQMSGPEYECISYSRPENRSEQIKRWAREAVDREAHEATERRHYERLRDKFEDDEVTRDLRAVTEALEARPAIPLDNVTF